MPDPRRLYTWGSPSVAAKTSKTSSMVSPTSTQVLPAAVRSAGASGSWGLGSDPAEGPPGAGSSGSGVPKSSKGTHSIRNTANSVGWLAVRGSKSEKGLPTLP